MNQDAQGLKKIVQEVEDVFAKHGVSGAVVVASKHFSYYGMFYPEGAPLSLEGYNDVRIDSKMLENTKNHAFIASLSGLAESLKVISQSATTTWEVIAAKLRQKHVG